MDSLRLPRGVEEQAGADAESLVRALSGRARLLWEGGELRAPQIELTDAFVAALRSAYSGGHVVRGFEGAERTLAAEERGLARVDRQTGKARGGRVSRLLILSDDGSERFYRNVEGLLRRHSPRLLALRVSIDEQGLGRMLFGANQVARLLLIERKAAVAALLLALLPREGSGISTS